MAIQQHPLPQDISAYRFRLIGDMTIKQFVSLGIGIVLAILFYSSPLPFFFKYPLAFVFLLLGVGMAFVPVQGRTLDTWIFAFLRSIYAPTQFIWKQTALENITSDTASPTSAANQQLAPVVSNARMEISKGVVAATPDPLTPSVTITPPTPEVPPAPPVISPPPDISPPSNLTPDTQQQSSISTPEVKVPEVDLPQPSAETPPPEVKTEIIPPTVNTPPTPEAPSTTSVVTTPPSNLTPDIQQQSSISPSTASQLPIPYTPTTPNTLVGLTITPDSKILDGVLVEIQKNGLTSRATKSNKLGQFMFARPLEDGLYQIFAEKDGFTFAPYSLELTGAIIRPLKIQAQ